MAQPKVSMVVPCYNKRDYIGAFLESVYNQIWDNIELILVNDGSTDGTRDVIAQWEPKLRERGYDVVIIDQENAGVCAAAKAGLEKITGDFVCQVDSDDELDPLYISTMAAWLEGNPDYDVSACGAVEYTINGKEKIFRPFTPLEISEMDPCVIEKYMLTLIRPTVWIYMVRATYFKKCRITETYYTATRGSHEPGYIIPLLAYGGKIKYFPLPLYRFNLGSDGLSRPNQYEKVAGYFDEYDKLCKISIERLPASVMSGARKQRLSDTYTLVKHRILYLESNSRPDGKIYAEGEAEKLIAAANQLFKPSPPITRKEILGLERIFIWAIDNALINYMPEIFNTPKGKIIGYGVLGKIGSGLLPYLSGTILEPIELWDIAGDNTVVKKPDFETLAENDLLLVFPAGKIESELRTQFKDAQFKAMYHTEIRDRLAYLLFGKRFMLNN